MRRLLLLRHAKTETDAPSGRDVDRRLDPRGRDDAALMGAWLAEQTQPPSRVLVSTAIRARQTWDIVETKLAKAKVTPQVMHLDELYGAGPAQLLEALQVEGDGAAIIMIIAHNPGLHELGFALTATGDATARNALTDNLPTGAIATLDFKTDDWNDVHFRSGHLASFVTPKSLRE
ncbi:MAG: phosphohistidine phosphatase [Tardiphaga sp.]|nr:phosphohistidine phosphatase [Tardiphaga sp.]